MRSLTAGVLIVLAAAVPAGAQSTFGSAPVGGVSFQPPPRREPATPPVSPVTPIRPAPPSPPPDLFRAGPDAYAPRHGHRLPAPGLVPFAIGYPMVPEVIVERPVVVVAPLAPTATAPSHRPAPPLALKPWAPITPPGHQRRLYVIPGCYVGDTRPVANGLPQGCSIDRLRLIPSR